MKKLESKIIYQIYPKSFLDTTGSGTGDIRGIIRKLDYLSELGVDYLWLCPICRSPQRDNGYDISDYYQIDDRFGSNKDYERLIEEADKRGMKIMMDLVLNHTSSDHLWFMEALKKDPRYKDYYIFRKKPNNLTSYFGGSAWSYQADLDEYYFRLFDESQPDLNWENPQVRNEIYQMINFWIKKGVGGFRLDVIDLIGKEPDIGITARGPKFYDYLKELQKNTFGEQLLTVGECWGATLDDCERMCGSNGLTQAFHFNHLTITNGKTKWHKKRLDLQVLAETLDLWQNHYDGIEALVMNNHDLPRLISTWLDDKIFRKESAKLLITLFGLLKGNLYLFQGEEIGMTNAYMEDIQDYNDVETLNKYKELMESGLDQKLTMEMIKATSRDNARTPMQWNEQKNSGFTEGTSWLKVNPNYKMINVDKDRNSPDSIYEYYKSIIAFRKENYDLINEKAVFKSDGDVFKFTKGGLKLWANFSRFMVPLKKERAALFCNYPSENREYLRPYEVWVSLD